MAGTAVSGCRLGGATRCWKELIGGSRFLGMNSSTITGSGMGISESGVVIATATAAGTGSEIRAGAGSRAVVGVAAAGHSRGSVSHDEIDMALSTDSHDSSGSSFGERMFWRMFLVILCWLMSYRPRQTNTLELVISGGKEFWKF